MFSSERNAIDGNATELEFDTIGKKSLAIFGLRLSDISAERIASLGFISVDNGKLEFNIPIKRYGKLLINARALLEIHRPSQRILTIRARNIDISILDRASLDIPCEACVYIEEKSCDDRLEALWTIKASKSIFSLLGRQAAYYFTNKAMDACIKQVPNKSRWKIESNNATQLTTLGES